MITNEALLNNYEASFSFLKEYYALVKASDVACALQQPPTVIANKQKLTTCTMLCTRQDSPGTLRVKFNGLLFQSELIPWFDKRS